MNIFNLTRDRDATPTIRGFVYQVDTTIERWFGLGDNEALELERGEDIDVVRQLLTGQLDESNRLLEQVKHREGSLTLRSPAARAFLANAFDHRVANPTLRLEFRYTTNASPAVERPTSIRKRTAGVTAWEALRRGAWPEADVGETLAAIREFLLGEAPEETPAVLWERFQAFIRMSTDDEFLEFIRVCEWSTRNIPAVDAAPALQQRLVEIGHAADESSAEALYFRLFAYVFRRLALPGLKRLTREDLHAQAEAVRSGADPEDRQTLDTVRVLLTALQGRVSALEAMMVEARAESSTALARIDDLARERGIRAAVAHLAAVPITSEPPLVDRLSARSSSVEDVLAECGTCTWIALHGTSGSGKSQLALLIARHLSGTRPWIRFRDLALPEAVLRFDAALMALAASRLEDITSLLHEFLRTIGMGAVVVLDDLPEYREGDDFAIRLASLVEAAHAAGVRVLSTGVHPVPSALRDQVGTGVLASIPVPPFTDSEAGDVLRAYGAPVHALRDEFISMVNALAGGHPVLLRASAQYLALRGWRLSADAFFGLLKKEFTSEIADETIRAVLRSVEDEDARDLLYRLNVTAGAFGQEELQALASIPPAISRRRERLQGLLGLWVQRETGARYSVSPRVRSLGTEDLAPEVLRGCHSALARIIVSRDIVDPMEVNRALMHYAAAKEYDSFAMLLLRALTSLNEAPFTKPLPPHLGLWTEYRLPEEVSPWLKPIVLALQIAVRLRVGDDTARWQRELDSLIPRLPPKASSSVLTATLLVAYALYPHDLAASGRYFAIATRIHGHAVATLQAASIPAPQLPLSGFVWLASGEVRTAENVDAWFRMIEGLPEDARESSFEDPLAARGAVHVVSTLLEAPDNYTAECRWSHVLATLESLESRAEWMRLEPLVAACVAVRISVHGEFLHDVDAAEELAVTYLSRGVGRNQEFLISNTMGLIFFDEKRLEKAAKWLERAATVRTESFAREGVRAAIRLSNIAGQDDTREAVRIAEEGLAFADQHLEDAEYAAVEARGELAIARWLDGDLEGSFRSWDVTAEAILAMRDDSPQWKGLVVLFGHVSGYLASVASSGMPPQLVSGDEPYAAPQRGIFLQRPPGRDTLYREVFFCYAFAHMTMFADGVADLGRAVHWATRGVEASRRAGYHQVAAVQLSVLRVDALGRADYTQVLAYALEEGAVTAAYRLQAIELDGTSRDLEVVLGPRSGQAWLDAEGHAVIHGLLLVFLHIARRLLTEVEGARNQASEAIGACRIMAAASPAPEDWHRAVDLLDRIFFGADTAAQLWDWVRRTAPARQEFKDAFRTIGYLGGALRPRILPVDSLSAQLAVGPFLDKVLCFAPGVRREVNMYFREFWLYRLRSESFRFSAPKRLQAHIEAASTDRRDALRRILNLVVTDLGVQPEPQPVAEWLRGGESA